MSNKMIKVIVNSIRFGLMTLSGLYLVILGSVFIRTNIIATIMMFIIGLPTFLIGILTLINMMKRS